MASWSSSTTNCALPLTVAVNEGVGGAVDGQAAESLRIETKSGQTQFLAQATAPRRAVLDPKGGVQRVPATGTPAVPTSREIDQLVRFARDVPKRFPSLRDANGKAQAADVEFAFKDGRLTLLQMRPFVESKTAQKSGYLSQLDARFAQRGQARVDLNGVPKEKE